MSGSDQSPQREADFPSVVFVIVWRQQFRFSLVLLSVRLLCLFDPGCTPQQDGSSKEKQNAGTGHEIEMEARERKKKAACLCLR